MQSIVTGPIVPLSSSYHTTLVPTFHDPSLGPVVDSHSSVLSSCVHVASEEGQERELLVKVFLCNV